MRSFRPRPLDGVRVVEFSHVIAGPFAGLQLRQLGAEVTKVEPPVRGDYLGSLPNGKHAYDALNAAKSVIEIDLRSDAGRERGRDLALEADVLLDSYRPGALKRHGLGYEELSAANPRLVYCSISGYGSEHALWGARGAYDHVVQALTGIAMQTGSEGDPPIKVGFPLIDSATGMLAVNAILAALLERARNGRGQYIEVSMWRAALQLMYPMACETLTTGAESPRVGNQGYTGSPGASFFRCREGWLALGANTAEQMTELARALEIVGPVPDPVDPVDPASAAAAAAFRGRIARCLVERDANAWEQLMHLHGVPAARVRTLGEFLEFAGAEQLLQAEAVGVHAVLSPGMGWRSFGPSANTAED
ncbi:MAG: CoA transferase [Burkholderiales bacterium]